MSGGRNTNPHTYYWRHRVRLGVKCSVEIIKKTKSHEGKKRDKNKKSVQSLSKNLQGVSVYQNKNPKTGKVERNIMTFRVISEKSKEEGKWNHPGRKGEKILDETFKWVEKAWQTQILPDLKRKYESK